MQEAVQGGKPLRGWHVLAMFVGGFSIIISVNLVLAFNAVASFPGVETKSSYVVSQHFQKDRAAQEALGWSLSLTTEAGQVRLAITDPQGEHVEPTITNAVLGRATTVAQDRVPSFVWDGQVFVASVALAPGNWNLRLEMTAPDGTPFRQRISFRVTP